MEFLYFLERIRMPGLNEAMLLITRLGEETAFLALALVVFWCVDKRRGYFLMTVGFTTTLLNQFLKLLCRVPRPWVLDENFTVLEGAKEAATGYSFPSGHSQSAVGTFGAIAATEKNRWIRCICIAIAILVPFSRMYLGVHTPADVLTGSAISLALVFVLRSMAGGANDRTMAYILGGMLVLALGLLAFVRMFPFPADVDPHNLESGIKNAYTMLGCIPGVMVVYTVEKKYVNFDTKACWWIQVLKVFLGLAAVLLVKEGLRAPLELLLPVYPARAARYFLIVLVAGLLWPMTFPYFARMGEKYELRGNQKL